MVIATRHKQAAMKEQIVTLALDICDVPVEFTENIKYLEVYIDSSLDWKKTYKKFQKEYRGPWGLGSTANNFYHSTH